MDQGIVKRTWKCSTRRWCGKLAKHEWRSQFWLVSISLESEVTANCRLSAANFSLQNHSWRRMCFWDWFIVVLPVTELHNVYPFFQKENIGLPWYLISIKVFISTGNIDKKLIVLHVIVYSSFARLWLPVCLRVSE